jgi:hypothetical protein
MRKPRKEQPPPKPDPPYLAALLADNPGLTREVALAMIREAGG